MCVLDVMSNEPSATIGCDPGLQYCSVPVGGDLDVQRHLDVEQVLVLAEVAGHLPLGALELIIQLVDGFLRTHTRTHSTDSGGRGTGKPLEVMVG